jgi:hypothetical protein
VRAARLEHIAEDPIARYERRRAWYQSRLIIILPLLIAVSMLLGCGPIFVVQKLFHGASWLHRPWGMPLLIGNPIIVAIGAGAWVRRFSPPKQFYTEAVLAPRSDSLQQQRWPATLLVTVGLGLELALMISMWTLLPSLRTALALLPIALSWLIFGAAVAIPALMSLVLLACLFGGRLSGPPALQRAMDDELTVVHRAKAMTTGFLVLLATLALLMAALAFAPPIVTRIGLIVCAYCGLAAASVRFALLERAAHMAARND